MINTVGLYREFSDPFNDCCEKGYPIVTDWVPYGSTSVPMQSLSDIPCNCEFGKIRSTMEKLMSDFDLDFDEFWENEQKEIKLFNAALLMMELEGEV